MTHSTIGHVHAERTGVENGRRLAVVLGLTALFAVVELVAGIWSGSLALQADAAHMFTDVGSLALALAAVWLGRRPAPRRATYGYYRLEILAALANAILLLAVAGYILYEAWARLREPTEVQTVPMLVVATLGLLVNLGGMAVLHGGAAHNLNLRGAFLELMSDAVASVAVLLAGVIVATTGWLYADPLLAGLVTLFVVPRVIGLLRAAVGVLLEATPAHIDVGELEGALLEVPGVRRVHDVHVWTITSGFDAMSGHAEVEHERAHGAALAEMRRVLRDRFSIEHATIQVEEQTLDDACVGDGCVGRT
jgi:cobalt-zinc-cadmium efflux system protein